MKNPINNERENLFEKYPPEKFLLGLFSGLFFLIHLLTFGPIFDNFIFKFIHYTLISSFATGEILLISIFFPMMKNIVDEEFKECKEREEEK